MSDRSIADAYTRTGAAWDHGPGRIYDKLSEELVARLPGGTTGRCVLDVGAGTGAAGRAAIAHGAAQVVAIDAAHGVLRVDISTRPPGVVADARRLPFVGGGFGGIVAAFSLNHLPDPATALAELDRVLQPGGGLVASAYAIDDTHPVKSVVDQACGARGWTKPAWYVELQNRAVPLLATPERALAACDGVLDGARAEVVRVPFPELDPRDLVAWRLGMAHLAPFVATLGEHERAELVEEATASLTPATPILVRSMVVLTWSKSL